jgi:hypothetical protein
MHGSKHMFLIIILILTSRLIIYERYIELEIFIDINKSFLFIKMKINNRILKLWIGKS